MAIFVVVKKVPETLNKGEYLIGKPSFIDQIALHKTKKPSNGLTGSNYIRMVVDSIAQAYDPENMSAYSIKAHNYEGRPIPTDEAFDAIVVEALKADYPAIFQKYLESKIRNRPKNTEKIIYLDSKISFQYETFYRNGFSEETAPKQEKPVSDKVVGKPAVKGNTFKADEKGNIAPATDAEIGAINAAEIISETSHTTKY